MGEATFLVEMVKGGSVDSGELRQGAHMPEAKHRLLPPSGALVGALRPIVRPATSLLPVTNAEVMQSGLVGSQTVCHDFDSAPVSLQGFP